MRSATNVAAVCSRIVDPPVGLPPGSSAVLSAMRLQGTSAAQRTAPRSAGESGVAQRPFAARAFRKTEPPMPEMTPPACASSA
jgi:hypothetical protein